VQDEAWPLRWIDINTHRVPVSRPYAKAAQESPSPAAMAILAKLAEAAKAGIKAQQKEK